MYCIMRALEGRRLAAVTHLAFARRQNRRNRHFGYNEREKLLFEELSDTCCQIEKQKRFTKEAEETKDVSNVQKNLF